MVLTHFSWVRLLLGTKLILLGQFGLRFRPMQFTWNSSNKRSSYFLALVKNYSKLGLDIVISSSLNSTKCILSSRLDQLIKHIPQKKTLHEIASSDKVLSEVVLDRSPAWNSILVNVEKMNDYPLTINECNYSIITLNQY